MTEFSVSDAAFEGFRITRENPAAVAVWIAIEIVLLAVTATIIGQNPAFALMADAAAHAQGDPQGFMVKIQELAPRLMPTLAATAPVSLVLGIILRTAVYRAVLRPAERGLGYVRLGMDELRVFGVTLLTAMIIFAVMVADGALIGVLGLAGPLGAMLGLLSMVAMIVLIAGVLLRLSLAGPQTFAERKLNLVGSLKLTKPIFWPMVGSYFIAFILYVVVVVLVRVISLALGAMLAGGGEAAMLGVGALALTKPLGLLELLLEGIMSGLGLAIITGPTALIYQLVTRNGARQADAF